ncbi:unnamed protein product, partial [Allacma fusca]
MDPRELSPRQKMMLVTLPEIHFSIKLKQINMTLLYKKFEAPE